MATTNEDPFLKNLSLLKQVLNQPPRPAASPAQLTQIQSDLAREVSLRQSLEGALDQLTTNRKLLQTQLDESNQSKQQLEAQVQELQETLASQQTQHEQEVAAVESKLADAQSKLETQLEAMDSLEAKLASANQRALDAEQALQSSMAARNADQDRHSQMLQDLQNSKMQTLKALEEAKERELDLQKQLTHERLEADDNSALEALQQDCGRLQKLLEASQQEATQNRTLLEALQTKVGNDQEQLEAKTKLLAQTQKLASLYKSKLEKLEKRPLAPNDDNPSPTKKARTEDEDADEPSA